MAGIRVVFFEECDEHLGELENGLIAIQEGDRDPETINIIFRAVHSIKGGASIFGLEALVGFAHTFENLLTKVRSGEKALDEAVIKTCLKAADVLADLVREANGGAAVEDGKADPLVSTLTALSSGSSAGAEEAEEEDPELAALQFQPVSVSFAELDVAAPKTLAIRFKPGLAMYAKANDAILILQELSRYGEVKAAVNTDALPLLDGLDPREGYLTWHISLLTTQHPSLVREVFEFVENDCELEISEAETIAPIAAPPPPVIEAPPTAPPVSFAPAPAPAPVGPVEAAPVPNQPQTQGSIRVDLDRVDRMIDLVSELVINQSILVQRLAGERFNGQAEVSAALEDLDKLTREIQDSVMAIRAQPVKAVFQRMSRLVREVEAVTRKPVRLVTEGDATEVDRTVIERLSDPLTHMIRNAIDHGIEPPEKRAAAGKPAMGTVKIAAAHRGGRIIIEVSDDGAGINRERVREKAVERGVIGAEDRLTDEETDNLIFAAGFSTADQVSDISGRGVGMDVVRSGVQALGGRITVTSVQGQGSTFTLSLPLTLAVMDGMLVQVGDQGMVVPLTALVESFQVAPGDVTRLGVETTFLHLRGANVPLLDLGAMLGYPRGEDEDGRHVALLVEDDSGQRAALLVNDILGQQQVVIKSLEANYREVPGVAAATILGDGRVALILDVNAILSRRRRVCAEPKAA